jgi:SnoaL-like domain
MARAARLISLPVAAFLISCHPAPQAVPARASADARVVLDFLEAYGHRDLDRMMACLAEDAVFLGTGATLSKPQIRAFFQASFQKHPGLRVEVGAPTEAPGAIQVRVKVQAEAIWEDTWIFEVRNHLIRSYRLASGRR